MANTNVDVIVVGAGISGLSAAKVLQDQGVKVVVVEARDRVGGRTWTVRDARYGGYTDVGGAYVGQTQRHLVRMVQSLGISIYRIYTAGKSVMDIQGNIFAHEGTVPPIRNPLIILDMNSAIQQIYKLCEQIPIEAPWNAPKAAEWDAMTMQQLIDKISWTGFTRQTLTIFYTVSLATNPKEVSMLYALWYTKNCQGLLRMITTENGGQEYKFVGGSMQISEKLAALLGDSVVLGEPVIRVEQHDKGVTVSTATGKTFTGNYVISAMPQALLNRVTFTPSLPPNKIQLFQHMPMGVACKTMIFYKTAMWREQGYSGQTASDSGLIVVSLDDTKPDGTAPCLIGFVVGSQGTQFARLSEEERKKQVAQHYAKIFKSDEYLKPVEYIDKLWPAEEYSGGCYVSALPPGALSTLGYAIREPIGRLYFAGTEASTDWSGYMNGAIQAGERTARQVLVTLGKLRPDQVEQEEPKPPGFPEDLDAFNFTLWERLMPSVPSFLLLCSATSLAALYFAQRSGHLTKLTNALFDRWQQ